MASRIETYRSQSLTPRIRQIVKGERNLVMGQMFGGTAIANVRNLYQTVQQPPRQQTLHQLPPDITDFTGRTQELDQVLAELRQGSPRKVVAISGMAGTGKSALVVRAAHELATEFDQVQLYIDLRGATEHQAVNPATVLVGWLRSLGWDDPAIPTELEELSRTYRSVLTGKRAVVLLDNAQDESQIYPLLPNSATCAVLVTSRKKLVALQGTTLIDLPVLPKDEALELFKKVLSEPSRVAAEPEQAEAILSLCGQLPLAIRIAAATLNQPSQQHKSLAVYALSLQDEKQRLTQLHLDNFQENLDVRTSLNLSYRELNDEQSRLFRWLGLLEAPDFGVAVAAVLVEADEESTQQWIDGLVNAQLLEVMGEGRYRFHDLTRLFAREQLAAAESTEVQADARQRVIQYFLEWLDWMDDCLIPESRREIARKRIAENETLSQEKVERDLEREAFRWFERERSTFLSLADWIILSKNLEQLAHLGNSLSYFWERYSYGLDTEQLCIRSLNAVRQLGNRNEEGEILANLAVVYSCHGKLAEAIDCCQQSLKISRELDNRDLEANVLKRLGDVYTHQGKWVEAIDCYQQSLKIFRELDNREQEALVLVDLGAVYQSLGKGAEAIDCYQQSLEISRELDNRDLEADVLQCLGNVYADQGKWMEAIDCYQQSLKICRKVGDHYGEGMILRGFGLIYLGQGEFGETINFFQQSLKIFRELGNREQEAVVLGGLSVVYQSSGKWTEAIDCYQQSLKISRELDNRDLEANVLQCLGGVYTEQGKWVEAIDFLQQSLKIFGESGNREQEAAVLVDLGVVYQSSGKWTEAIDCYQQSLKISQELGDRHGEGSTLANLGAFYQKQKQNDHAISLWQKALTKLNPDSSDYQTVTEWLEAAQAPPQSWLQVVGFGIVAIVFLIFLGSNLLAGRWGVALAIVAVAGVAFLILRAMRDRI